MRLGKNQGRYFGETIDIDKVLAEARTVAQQNGWSTELIYQSADKEILALKRLGVRESRRIYLSTGIHGDEPAGPLSVLGLLQEDRWPEDASIWLCPCLNPTGFRRNTRENAAGVDLNRDYLEPGAAETVAHLAWLDAQPAFDVTLCLHEDWESHGFYVYELNPDGQPSFAEPMVKAVAEVCPIDLSEVIEGREAYQGIIRPSVDPLSRPQWPEAFYLLKHKTRLSYTLEAPSDFIMSARVAALQAAVRTVLGG